MSPGLYRIESVSNHCGMLRKNVRRCWLTNSFPVQRRACFFAINEPSEYESIRIDGPGGVGERAVTAVLECGKEA